MQNQIQPQPPAVVLPSVMVVPPDNRLRNYNSGVNQTLGILQIILGVTLIICSVRPSGFIYFRCRFPQASSFQGTLRFLMIFLDGTLKPWKIWSKAQASFPVRGKVLPNYPGLSGGAEFRALRRMCKSNCIDVGTWDTTRGCNLRYGRDPTLQLQAQETRQRPMHLIHVQHCTAWVRKRHDHLKSLVWIPRNSFVFPCELLRQWNCLQILSQILFSLSTSFSWK